MQGPHAFANTVPPNSLNVSAWWNNISSIKIYNEHKLEIQLEYYSKEAEYPASDQLTFLYYYWGFKVT